MGSKKRPFNHYAVNSVMEIFNGLPAPEGLMHDGFRVDNMEIMYDDEKVATVELDDDGDWTMLIREDWVFLE